MNTLYLDLLSGISGDMFLGALLDLGLDFQKLQQELQKLKLDGYHLHATRSQKASIAGTKFDVHLETEHHHHEHDEGAEATHSHGHGHEQGHGHSHTHLPSHSHPHAHSHTHGHTHDEERTFTEIQALIQRSALSDWVKQKSIAIFQRIAVAEGKIHGVPPEQVHFHEVGAVDSIVDIVGACAGLELLDKPRLLASQVIEGNGWVDCAHGRFPVPAPATLAILGARGIPLTQCNETQELVTPTGAALLAELVEAFGPMESLVAERIGFGLGTRENRTRPNVLRAVLGHIEAPATAHDWETDTIAIVETNLDDISPELLGNFVETALQAGALDVFHTPIQMKKNRPGVLLSVLCATNEADRFAELMLRETTSFGVRRSTAERRKLAREFVDVTTPCGPVTMKIGKLDGQVLQAAPEYESCRRLAQQIQKPLREIYEAAMEAAAALRRPSHG